MLLSHDSLRHLSLASVLLPVIAVSTVSRSPSGHCSHVEAPSPSVYKFLAQNVHLVNPSGDNGIYKGYIQTIALDISQRYLY